MGQRTKKAVFTIPEKTKFNSSDKFQEAAAFWEYDGQICYLRESGRYWYFEDGANFEKDRFLASWLHIIEDEVITAEEWCNKQHYTSPGYGIAFKAGEKNQWVNHKKLREAVKQYLKSWSAYDLEDALKNIKPL